jgi:argininosuccinate synthase
LPHGDYPNSARSSRDDRIFSSSPLRTKSPSHLTPKAPWSQDENLVHCSYEAGILDGPDHTPSKDLWTQTVDPLEAPDKPFDFTVHFEKGLPIKAATPDQEATDSVELFKLLNKIGHDHGVGRIDMYV